MYISPSVYSVSCECPPKPERYEYRMHVWMCDVIVSEWEYEQMKQKMMKKNRTKIKNKIKYKTYLHFTLILRTQSLW